MKRNAKEHYQRKNEIENFQKVIEILGKDIHAKDNKISSLLLDIRKKDEKIDQLERDIKKVLENIQSCLFFEMILKN